MKQYKNIRITKTALCTSICNNRQELVKSINGRTKGIKIDDHLYGISPCEATPHPIYIAEIVKYSHLNPQEKIIRLLQETVTAFHNKTKSLFKHKKIILHFVLPPKNSLRNILFQKNRMAYILENIFRNHSNIEIEVSHNDDCVYEIFKSLCKQLQNEQCDVVFLGGIDSLINIETITELNQSKRLMTTKSAYGIIPGEACAIITLEKSQNNSATIEVSSYDELLNTKRVINEVIRSTGTEANSPLHWYKMEQLLWPCPTSPPTIFETSHYFGEVGAATIPLQLIIATTKNKNILCCYLSTENREEGYITIKGASGNSVKEKKRKKHAVQTKLTSTKKLQTTKIKTSFYKQTRNQKQL